MIFSESGVTLFFKSAFLTKNVSQHFTASSFFIPYFSKNRIRLNCPVRAISWYLHRTQTSTIIYHHEKKKKKPARPAAKSTLDGWLVDGTMNTEALHNKETPKAYSVRVLSSSWAFAKGCLFKISLTQYHGGQVQPFSVGTYMNDVGLFTSSHRYANEVSGLDSPEVLTLHKT